jgi:hypothetical protein
MLIMIKSHKKKNIGTKKKHSKINFESVTFKIVGQWMLNCVISSSSDCKKV